MRQLWPAADLSGVGSLVRFPMLLAVAAACSLTAVAVAASAPEPRAAASAAATASPLASSVTERFPSDSGPVPATATESTPPAIAREPTPTRPDPTPAVTPVRDGTFAAVLPHGVVPTEGQWFVEPVADAIVEGLNEARTGAGLPPLARDERLDEVARARAADLVERGYFAHVAPDGGTAFTELQSRGIRYGLAGENLARNTYPEGDAARVALEGWLASPGHRANVLEPRFVRVGVAVTRANTTWVIVAVFTD